MFQPRPTNDQNSRCGWRIAIVGTGGQGVLTAARLLCAALVEEGREVVSSQLRGMALRGGSVQASVMIDCGICPVIAAGAADVVLGLEPAETVRALPLMSSRTLVLMNTTPVIPFVLALQSVLQEKEAEYPDVRLLVRRIGAVTPDVHAFDATALAAETGSDKTLNMIMLGCLLGTGALPCAGGSFLKTITRIIPPPLVGANTTAYLSGVAVGQELQVAEARL